MVNSSIVVIYTSCLKVDCLSYLVLAKSCCESPDIKEVRFKVLIPVVFDNPNGNNL